MSMPSAARLAWSLWALNMALLIPTFALEWLDRDVDILYQIAVQFLHFLVVAMFLTVGAIIAARLPKNPIGWIFIVAAGLITVSGFAQDYALYALAIRPGSLPWGEAMGVLSLPISGIGINISITLIFLLFPNGHVPSPRWRPLVWITIALLVPQMVMSLFLPVMLNVPGGGTIRNPLASEGISNIASQITGITTTLFFAVAIVCASSVLVRFRSANQEERQQIKWVAYAAGFDVVLFLITIPLLSVFPYFDDNPVLSFASDIVYGLGFTALPLSIGIAMLKYRLYDIDAIINRTLVYGTLTAALALLYWGSIVLLQTLFSPVFGAGNDFAIVISTLAIAALFTPLRRALQRFIDRRFYRHSYDAAQTLAAFGATARDEVDLESLTARLVEVVNYTMQPTHVSLWLLEDRPTERFQQ